MAYTIFDDNNFWHLYFNGRNKDIEEGRHSSVDSSAPTILPPRVWVPSTQSRLLSLYLSCEKDENKPKEAGFGPFLKNFNLNIRSTEEYIPVFSSATTTDYFGVKFGAKSRPVNNDPPSTGFTKYNGWFFLGGGTLAHFQLFF